MALISVARGLDFCGNMLGAGKETVFDQNFLLNGEDVFFTAYVDVQYNLHLRIWQQEEYEIASGVDFIASLEAIIASAKGNVRRHIAHDAAWELLIKETWVKLQNVPDSLYLETDSDALKLSTKIQVWLKSKELDVKDNFFWKSHNSGWGKVYNLCYVRPEIASALKADLDLEYE